MSTLRLCLWSGPRNVSTALMYSFAQRPDTRVVDEPLYAHYLRVSGAEHPGRAEVLAAQDPDGGQVVREIVLGPCDRPLLLLKMMAHHLVDLDLGFLRETVNVLLIRHPREVLATLPRQIPHPVLDDTGLPVQLRLYEDLAAAGRPPVVVDSRYLLLDPQGVLEQLCQRVGVPFLEAMLQWPAGARPEDGVWAPYWYHAVHRSTGFEPYRPKQEELLPPLEPLLAECLPYYDALLDRALRTRGDT